jgi:hypothetical protein
MLKKPFMAPCGEESKQPEEYVWDSPGLMTGFFPITPSPSTISKSLRESNISQCRVIN